MPPGLDIAAIVAALGALINPLTSIAKKDAFPQWLNALIAILLSAGGGAVAVAVSGTFTSGLHNPQAWMALSALVYTASQAVYHALFRDSALDTVLTTGSTKPPIPTATFAPFDKRGR